MMHFSCKTVLIPIDFSETSMLAVRHAAFLAQYQKSTLYVLHVININFGSIELFVPVIDFNTQHKLVTVIKPSGVSASVLEGNVSVKVDAVANALGVSAKTSVGNVNVWGTLLPNQNPNWNGINNSQNPNWNTVSNSQSPGWSTIDNSETPAWSTINNTQSPNWNQIAA